MIIIRESLLRRIGIKNQPKSCPIIVILGINPLPTTRIFVKRNLINPRPTILNIRPHRIAIRMNDFHVKFTRREHIPTSQDHFENDRKRRLRLGLMDQYGEKADSDNSGRHSGNHFFDFETAAATTASNLLSNEKVSSIPSKIPFSEATQKPFQMPFSNSFLKKRFQRRIHGRRKRPIDSPDNLSCQINGLIRRETFQNLAKITTSEKTARIIPREGKEGDCCRGLGWRRERVRWKGSYWRLDN